MKKSSLPPIDPATLHETLLLLLEANLEDSQIEQYAKEILKQTRRAGYRFSDPSRGCPECAACLHLALMSALQSMESKSAHLL